MKFYDGWGFREGALFYIASLIMYLSVIPMFFVPEGGVKSNSKSKLESSSEISVFSSNDQKNQEEEPYLLWHLYLSTSGGIQLLRFIHNI